MYRDRLVTALAAAFAAMSAALAVTGLVANYLVLVPAALFGVVAYFMWFHASGRLARRIYRGVEGVATGGGRAERRGQGRGRRSGAADRGGFGAGPREDWERPRRGPQDPRQRARASAGGQRVDGSGGTRARRAAARRQAERETAFDVLGVEPGADEETIREAYRERVKEVHPDNGGSQAAFRRVRDAYERLAD